MTWPTPPLRRVSEKAFCSLPQSALGAKPSRSPHLSPPLGKLCSKASPSWLKQSRTSFNSTGAVSPSRSGFLKYSPVSSLHKLAPLGDHFIFLVVACPISLKLSS